MPRCCTVQTRAVQSPIELFIRGTKHSDVHVIFNHIIIEMASLYNPGVSVTGVPISKGSQLVAIWNGGG